MTTSSESLYEKVYGETFAMYDRDEMLEFIEPLRIRFLANGLNPDELFAGKRCLDAGCGSGRGSLFMLQHGAEFVEAVDFSHRNVDTATGWARNFGFPGKFRAQQSSLEAIPFGDEEFDVVWCNGVIHHTAHPNPCMSELSRVLKPGGQSWLYFYGAGGVYWAFVYAARKLLSTLDVDVCIQTLQLFRYETGYIAEYIDDWYASHLRTYTHADLSKSLKSHGFQEPTRLLGGTPYDTSEHVRTFNNREHQCLVGEGDLRYWATKETTANSGKSFLLDEGPQGSAYQWPEQLQSLHEALAALTDQNLPETWQKVSVCARIQRGIREILASHRPFTVTEIVELVNESLQLSKEVTASSGPEQERLLSA